MRLPDGRHFAVAWHIPDGYGGMTSALLHRSRAFARLGGVEVEVVTFDARPDYPALESRLRDAGELAPGVHLVNLYDWLRAHPLPGGRFDAVRTPLTPLTEGVAAVRDGVPMSRTRVADDGTTVLQRDHYRADGTLVLSDRRDLPGGGRSVVLCDERGMPVRGWRRIRSLYGAWLDALAGDGPAHLIVDSTVSAANLLDYRRPASTIVHVLHNSHLADPEDPLGDLRPRRRPVLERLDAFDAVVVLTERQRSELVARLRPRRDAVVIPNARELPPRGRLRRDARRAVVVASLTGRKKVQRAIRATGRVEGSRLDVYGEGDRRSFLEGVASTQPHGEVAFHGHRPEARARLAEASVLLLTSRFEGSPLVLQEAMGAGCLPIAVDIRYGPGDVIRDGVDGWLVPPGDQAALNRAVRTAMTAPGWRLALMRIAARRSAARYRDEQITKRWAHLLTRLATGA